jgi:SAM-dependent methyltransferase
VSTLAKFLTHSARRIPAVDRVYSEIRRLRLENASQLAAIREVTAERDALRSELAQAQGAIRSKTAASPVRAGPALGQQEVARYFTVPLKDLGSIEAKYAGVLSPEPEVSQPKVGVSETLLSGAEEYFNKFENFSYVFNLLKAELDALAVTPCGIAVDFGSGFGNTVIPLLENFPDLSIIATDISPDLLAILLREASKRGLRDRCAAIAFDAQRDYTIEGFADIVFGGAVLHHLIEPEALLKIVIKVLKPGGHAIFFEPFENGHAVLRLAYEEILSRAAEKGETGRGFEFLQRLVTDIAVRTHRQNYPGFSQQWYQLDDKWLFTHTYFDQMRRLVGAADVRIRPFNAPTQPFTAQARSTLVNYGGLGVPDALPPWAWDVLRRYDEDLFSPEMRNDLVIEGAVVITK